MDFITKLIGLYGPACYWIALQPLIKNMKNIKVIILIQIFRYAIEWSKTGYGRLLINREGATFDRWGFTSHKWRVK